MLTIETLKTVNDATERMSTQDLLLSIEKAVTDGVTDFTIHASGQHDIGGPLWNTEGKPLSFLVTNPGQRVGSMCLENTEVTVEGSAPADVGWLNAGGKIVVRGDAGDTAGHCAAAGTIYIGGRAGTRSGSLMKHDPLYQAPQLWILENTGSFSFEFMGGGRAVVCGHGCESMPSVLGARPCVGMVGGLVYVRGKTDALPADATLEPLSSEDIAWLESGMEPFLKAIGRQDLLGTLSRWDEWHKIVPHVHEEKHPDIFSVAAYRNNEWVNGGIFTDVLADDFGVCGLVARGLYRQRIPVWDNARYQAPCEYNCPSSIPTQQRYNLLRAGKTEEAYRLILEYSPFPASVCGNVCPNPCMSECTRGEVDFPIQIGALGRSSLDVPPLSCAPATGKHVDAIGGWVDGLSAAWQLVRMGHEVTVYEADAKMGGKLEQVIPRARLSQEILKKELDRIEAAGVHYVNNYPVDAAKFAALRSKHDALVLATGGHIPRIFPWPGHEKIIGGVDFLKAVNRGESPSVGKNVIVIGCGNAGMDAAAGAYEMGAESVICIDVQQPAAFAHEIEHIESLGGTLMWPVMTKEITEEGIVATDGRLIPGDTIIITIGETPDLSYLPDGVNKFRDWLAPEADGSILDGVFAVGDVIKPALLTHAIGSGAQVAHAVDAYVRGVVYQPEESGKLVPRKTLKKAYFASCNRTNLPQAHKDDQRCVSCGTCRDCQMCLTSCPEKAIDREETAEGFRYVSDAERCIGCGICSGICPCGIWTMQQNISLE